MLEPFKWLQGEAPFLELFSKAPPFFPHNLFFWEKEPHNLERGRPLERETETETGLWETERKTERETEMETE